MRRIVAFIILLGLTYGVFWRGLSFTFWKDDWYYLWSALYEPKYLGAIWLHPGTTIEFFAFSHLFGQSAVLWQHAGIVLRAGASLAVLDLSAALFGSVVIAWMSAVIFMVMPLGMEAVSWPSAHVTELIALLFCEATALYMAYLAGRKRALIPAIVLYLAAFIADPVRIASLLWVPVFLGYGNLRAAFARADKTGMVVLGIGAMVSVIAAGWFVWPFYTLWYHDHLVGFVITPKMLGVVIHYPNIVWNAFTGWIVPVPHVINEISHSVFYKTAGILGAVAMVCVFGAVRKNKKLFFAYLWVLSTLFIQWLPEPRLIPATAHRYFVLPSVGLALLLGWAIGHVPLRMKWLAAVLVIGIAWHTTTMLLGEMAEFRTATTVDRIWQTIDHTVSPGSKTPVIVIMGEEPMKTNVVDIDATGHFMLIRWNRGIRHPAIFTTDGEVIKKYRCADIYAFSVLQSAIARDDTTSFRKGLQCDSPVLQ